MWIHSPVKKEVTEDVKEDLRFWVEGCGDFVSLMIKLNQNDNDRSEEEESPEHNVDKSIEDEIMEK